MQDQPTLLQAQVQQISKLLSDKISRELADGARVHKYTSDLIEVEGVGIWQNDESGNCYVEIKVASKEITAAFNENREELEQERERLQKQLEIINQKIASL